MTDYFIIGFLIGCVIGPIITPFILHKYDDYLYEKFLKFCNWLGI